MSRRARESGDPTVRAELARAVGELDLEQQTKILRAFALFFQLANIAEQHHRIRRRRDVEREQGVPRESLAEAFRRLREAGIDDAALAEAARHVSLELVLTAHPTEATRRTILHAQARLGDLLDRARRRRERGGDGARRGDHRPLADRRGASRAAARGRRDPPRPVVLRAEPPRRSRGARRHLPPLDPGRRAAASVRHLDRRRPWTATPHAGPDTIEEALDRARALALVRYRAEVRELAAALGLTLTLVSVSDELAGVDRARRARAPRLRGARSATQNRDEPYRRKLTLRLVATRERGLRAGRGARWRISTSSTGACVHTAARGSPTAGWPPCVAASSSSASTSRSSTCASTRTSWAGGRRAFARRSASSAMHSGGSGSARSTR